MSSLSIPPELQQPIPRLTKPTGQFWFVTILSSIVFLIILFVDGHIVANDYRIYKIRQSGILVNGEVVSIHVTSGRGRHCAVTYQYTAVTNATHVSLGFQRQASVPMDKCYASQVGQTIAVMYDDAHPQNAALANETITDGMPLAFILLMYGAIFVINFRSYANETRLLATGRVVIGKIIDRKVVSGGKGSKTLTLTVEFKTDIGETITSTKKGVSMSAISDADTQAVVIYDPQDEENICIYPPNMVLCKPASDPLLRP